MPKGSSRARVPAQVAGLGGVALLPDAPVAGALGALRRKGASLDFPVWKAGEQRGGWARVAAGALLGGIYMSPGDN